MTFSDLPEDWAQHAITGTPRVHDVIDLMVDLPTRRRGALVLLLCDAADRLVQPVVIDDAPLTDPSAAAEAARMLGPLTEHLSTALPAGISSVVIALARPGGLSVTQADRDWAHASQATLGTALALRGVHVVTPDGSRPVPAVA